VNLQSHECVYEDGGIKLKREEWMGSEEKRLHGPNSAPHLWVCPVSKAYSVKYKKVC
jgi:hypothetical protein